MEDDKIIKLECLKLAYELKLANMKCVEDKSLLEVSRELYLFINKTPEIGGL